jgi:hypothetical protein
MAKFAGSQMGQLVEIPFLAPQVSGASEILFGYGIC